MNFNLDEELSALGAQVRAIINEHVIPAEAQVLEEDANEIDVTLQSLRRRAKEAGLWTPHLPKEHGGRGLGFFGMAVLFREMGRSLIGPSVFGCDAPDQGNMDLLIRAASPAIQAKYLKPLCAGETTSAFCMTEPAPGAGADPRNLRTSATREGDEWRIDGHKWYSTGGDRAAFLIVMARTSDDPRAGATLFIVDRHAPGVTHLRDIDVLAAPMLTHREAEFRFDNVRVSDAHILGGVGQGFALAQKRLVPARLTHCMRWLGLADRALSLCRKYLAERISFGQPLNRHQAVQAMVAENATAIHSGNLMTFHCAWLLAQGDLTQARTFSSMAKTHVANALCKTLDDAIQMHGGLGYSHDMPFARWYTYARAGRIADGPDEVHRWVVARDYLMEKVDLLG
mgnify:CR=1 FL=1